MNFKDLLLQQRHERQIQELHREYRIETSRILVPHFYEHGQISEEDYNRWLLDETIEFRPNLINKDNE